MTYLVATVRSLFSLPDSINMFFDSGTNQLYLDSITKPRPKHIAYTRHFIKEIVNEIYGIKVHFHDIIW